MRNPAHSLKDILESVDLIDKIMMSGLVEAHSRYLLEVPVEGEDSKVVFNGNGCNKDIGQRYVQSALFQD